MDDDEILWEKCWSICWCLYRCRIAGVIGVSRLAKKQEDSLWDLITLSSCALYSTLIYYTLYALYWIVYTFYTYRAGKETRGQPVRPHNTLWRYIIQNSIQNTVWYTLCSKHYTLKTTHRLHTILYYTVCTIYSTYSRPAREHPKRPHRVINCLPAVRY